MYKLNTVELSAKDKLIRAAEELFAKKGLGETSLREISTAAGQKNKNAVQYHFGDKKALIAAIWQRHAINIEASRIELLSGLASSDELTIDTLAQSIVLPVASKLNDPDGGRHYIQVMSRLISYSGVSLFELFEYVPDITNEKIMQAVNPYVGHLSDADKLARGLLIAGLLFHGLSDYIRLTERESPFSEMLSEEQFLKNIIRMVKAAIIAE